MDRKNILIGISLSLLLFSQGCYTQLAMFYPEPEIEQENEDQFFETYSRIVREFMIRGVVPISTDAFGIPDVIDDNVNGFIINKPLETGLYNILKKILTDKNILDNAKKNIKNVTITSPEDELHDIFEIYQKLTGFSSNLKK